jgi:type VI secretion system secreted protein Hcp
MPNGWARSHVLAVHAFGLAKSIAGAADAGTALQWHRSPPVQDCRREMTCLCRGVAMASDIFAKIGDIKGESLDDKHKDEIEVLSFSWGVTNSGSMAHLSAVGEGKATFQDLSIVHHIDKASPLLMQACATGQHLKEATITHRKSGKGQQEFLIVKMNDVIITAVTHGGSSDQPASENVTMAFAKVNIEYRPQRADGSIDAGIHFKYDLKGDKIG